MINITEDDVYNVENPELISAIGASLALSNEQTSISVSELIKLVSNISHGKKLRKNNNEKALFNSQEDFEAFNMRHKKHRARTISLDNVKNANCFLGVDSGSTTTKIVIIDDNGNILLKHYRNNNGNPIEANQYITATVLSLQQCLKEGGKREG